MSKYDSRGRLLEEPSEDRPKTDAEKVRDALAVLWEYGVVDGHHHKQWVIDQILRALTDDEGDLYQDWVSDWENPSDEEEEYEWETGIAP